MTHTIPRNFIPLSLAAALVFSGVCRGQDQPAPKAAPAAKAADKAVPTPRAAKPEPIVLPGPTDAAVQTILDSKPASPPELLQAILSLLELDRADVAKPLVATAGECQARSDCVGRFDSSLRHRDVSATRQRSPADAQRSAPVARSAWRRGHGGSRSRATDGGGSTVGRGVARCPARCAGDVARWRTVFRSAAARRARRSGTSRNSSAGARGGDESRRRWDQAADRRTRRYESRASGASHRSAGRARPKASGHLSLGPRARGRQSAANPTSGRRSD